MSAGRVILKELSAEKTLTPAGETEYDLPETSMESMADEVCMTCHDMEALVSEARAGYSHFERVHGLVLERGTTCGQCHAEMFPYDVDRHQIDP